MARSGRWAGLTTLEPFLASEIFSPLPEDRHFPPLLHHPDRWRPPSPTAHTMPPPAIMLRTRHPSPGRRWCALSHHHGRRYDGVSHLLDDAGETGSMPAAAVSKRSGQAHEQHRDGHRVAASSSRKVRPETGGGDVRPPPPIPTSPASPYVSMCSAPGPPLVPDGQDGAPPIASRPGNFPSPP